MSLRGPRNSVRLNWRKRFRKLRSSLKRSPCSRMKLSRARVCIGIWTGPLTTPTKEALTARAAELGSAALILMGFFVESKRTAQREGGGKLQRISIHIQLGDLASGGSPSCVDALSGRWGLKRHGRRNTSKLKRLRTK